ARRLRGAANAYRLGTAFRGCGVRRDRGPRSHLSTARARGLAGPVRARARYRWSAARGLGHNERRRSRRNLGRDRRVAPSPGTLAISIAWLGAVGDRGGPGWRTRPASGTLGPPPPAPRWPRTRSHRRADAIGKGGELRHPEPARLSRVRARHR